MRSLHREIVEKCKTAAIVTSILVICIMITISNLLSKIKIYDITIKDIINPIIFLLTIMYIIFQIISCRTKYKYIIIGDKLIINKIINNTQVNLENIDMSDIIFIGKNIRLNRNYRISATRRYITNIFEHKICCVHRKGNRLEKFYFQPSEEMIIKIKESGINISSYAS